MRSSEYLIDGKDFEIANLRAEVKNLKEEVKTLNDECKFGAGVMFVFGSAIGAFLGFMTA